MSPQTKEEEEALQCFTVLSDYFICTYIYIYKLTKFISKCIALIG